MTSDRIHELNYGLTWYANYLEARHGNKLFSISKGQQTLYHLDTAANSLADCHEIRLIYQFDITDEFFNRLAWICYDNRCFEYEKIILSLFVLNLNKNTLYNIIEFNY